MIERTKYTEYALDVVNHQITASRYVKMSCERFLAWFERDDIEFRTDKVDKVVMFISRLKHYMGASTDKPFLLSDWQFFIIENLLLGLNIPTFAPLPPILSNKPFCICVFKFNYFYIATITIYLLSVWFMLPSFSTINKIQPTNELPNLYYSILL